MIVPPTEEFGGPEFAAVVITSDLGVGSERLAFGVVRRDGPPLQAESATVRTYFLPPNSDAREARQSLAASFEPWPFSAGVFATKADFDVAGTWELETELTTADGQRVMAKSAFAVKEVSDTPAVGAPAPASASAVASDVPDLSHISTAQDPDPALYAVSIQDAIAEGKPLVVCFSTPRYCTTGTCGPQVEQLGGLLERYGERANVVHVEVYKEPAPYRTGNAPRHRRRGGGRAGSGDCRPSRGRSWWTGTGSCGPSSRRSHRRRCWKRRCWRCSTERPGFLRPARHTLVLLAVIALCVLVACSEGCNGEPGVVRGSVVEAVDRDLAAIETLRVRDGDGRVWTFSTEGPLEKNGAHLRLHQVLGQTIEVRYEERDGRLIAVGLRD